MAINHCVWYNPIPNTAFDAETVRGKGMNITVKRILLAVTAFLFVLPIAAPIANAIDFESIAEATMSTEQKIEQLDAMWAEVDGFEEKLLMRNSANDELIAAVYEKIAARDDIKWIHWESDTHFMFQMKSGIICVYDTVARGLTHSEYKGASAAANTLDALTNAGVVTGNGAANPRPGTLNIGVYSPYYGSDSNMTLNYVERARAMKEVLGDDCTVYDFYGSNASIENFKRWEEFGIILVDSHGNTGTVNGVNKSWICNPNPGSYDSADLTEGNLYSGGSWIGITGSFFAKYCPNMPNTYVYFGICLGMATDGLWRPLIEQCGAGFVCGYTQSVTFKYDGLMVDTIHEYLVTKHPDDPSRFYTAEEACLAAQEIHGSVDPYGSNQAVLVWHGDTDLVLMSDPVAATAVALTPASKDLYINNTFAFDVVTTPADANTYTLAWTSSDDNVATVDAKGLVTAKNAGTATITVSLTDNINNIVFTSDAVVNVIGAMAVSGISITPEAVDTFVGADPTQLTYTIEPENASNKAVTWMSSNSGVAAVDENGLVTPVSGGSAVITATTADGGFAASVNVTVTSLDDALNVDGGSLSFTTDSTYPWTATEKDGRACATSGNAGVHYSTSSVSTAITMKTGETLSFDWNVDCEASSSNWYDYLGFYVNGSSDPETRIKSTTSGTETGWATYAYTAASDGEYTFTWTYTKDRSVSYGNDCGWLDNVSYSGDAAEPVTQYTVTFVDSLTNQIIERQKVDEGSDAVPPTPPTHSQYVFAGWEGDYTNVTADVRIVATYAKAQLTVTFVDHDGTVLDTQTVNYGEAATAPAAPAREGYHFVAWDVAFDNITADTTVMAQYTAAPIIKMLGASYRTTPNKGIRFGGQLDKNFDTNYITITKIGMLIIPENVLNGAELTVDTSKVLNVNITSFITNNDEMYQFVVTLTNLSDSLLDRRIAARAYVEYTFNGEVYRLYSDTVIRSYNELAQQ